MKFRHITTIAAATLAFSAPATLMASTATASTKTEKAQNKIIKKLQRDVKILSARINSDHQDFVDLYSCLYTVGLTWYGNSNGNNTDGYSYLQTDGTVFYTDAMAPTPDGEVPTAQFLTFDCSAPYSYSNRSFNKSRLFLPARIGKPVAHRLVVK